MASALRSLRPGHFVALGSLLVALAYPAVANADYMFLAATVFIYTLAAVGVNVLHGYTGQISLAQGALVMLGAYSTAILCVNHGWPFWATVPPAILVAMAAALIMSLPAIRLGSWFLAVVTLILATLLGELIVQGGSLTNGGGGIIGVPGVPLLDAGAPLDPVGLYYLMLALVVAALIACWNLRRSPLGRALVAIKSSEVVAQAAGVPVYRMKVFAYLTAAAVAAVAGSFWAGLNHVVTPDEFPLSLSFFILLAIVVGGQGSLAAPVIGALFLVAVPELMAGLAQWRLVIYGSLLLVLALFAPSGVSGLAEQAWRSATVRGPRQVVQAWLSTEGRPAVTPALQAMFGAGAPPPFEVRIDRLSRSFGGNRAVVEVQLAIPAGSIHGLIGPNGSGKTTLLNLISGYYSADSGSITIGGHDVTRWTATRRSAYGIARTFQQPRLLEEESVLTNVMLGGYRLTSASIPEWICWLGRAASDQRRQAEEAREALAFLRMEHLAGVRANQLAHGQRRLVEVARTLVAHPRLLLLDEPAAGLPPNQVERLGDVITTLQALGMTILLIEHNVDLVTSVVERLTVMDAGRVLASGPALDVIGRPDVLAAYIGVVPTAGLD